MAQPQKFLTIGLAYWSVATVSTGAEMLLLTGYTKLLPFVTFGLMALGAVAFGRAIEEEKSTTRKAQ